MTNNIKNILQSSNLSMAEISRRYKIPYRTLQHWKDGSRKPPEYVVEMLNKLLKNPDA